MKVSKRDILLLVGFIGILAAVCSYLFVWQPTNEKSEKLEAENEQLQARINDLNNKMANKDTYAANTESMKNEIDAIYQKFPVDVREEDALLLAINQELISPMSISSITIGSNEAVIMDDMTEGEEIDHTYEIDEVEEYEAQEGIDDGGDAEASTVEIAEASMDENGLAIGAWKRNVTMNYLVSYEGLKRGIKNISVQDNRMSIDNLTVTFDESTGLLAGSTSVNMFSIPNLPDKEYVQPNFSSVLLGTSNIFGSMEIRSEAGLPDIEGADAEEGAEGEEE